MATKKSRKRVRRLNDPLRELLEFVVQQIEKSPQDTQKFVEIRNLRKALTPAIRKLLRFPGPAETPTD